MTEMGTAAKAAGSRNRLPLIAAIALVAAGLAGCNTTSTGYRAETVGAMPDDYRVNHPITIAEQLATFDVPVGATTRILPVAMRSNVQAFGSSFVASGAAKLAIVIPVGSTNQTIAGEIARQVEDVLVAGGVPRISIEYRSYSASPGETQAPLRLAYSRIAASTAGCGAWTDDVTRNNENLHYNSYGCAAQNNLAAMVQNPLDLLYPRLMTPPNAARRNNVLDNYQSGAATGGSYPSAQTISGL